MQKINVLLLAPPPWATGGVETRVRELVKQLIPYGINIKIIAATTDRRIVGTYVWEGVEIILLNRRNYFPYWVDNLMHTIIQESKRCDIIDIQGLKNLDSLIAILANTSKKPIIVTPHHHAGTSRPSYKVIKSIYDFLFFKIFIKKINKIICVSNFEKKAILTKYPNLANKISLIPNGITRDHVDISPHFSNKKNILYVGRLEKYKNVHLAITALQFMPSEYALTIIGDGSYKVELQKLINSLNLNDHVNIISNIATPELYRWYSTSNLVINLSSQEAFGITVLEALAANKPVIVNKSTAMVDFAEKFDQVHAIDLTTTSPQMLANIFCKYYGSQSDPINLEQYSWDTISKKMFNLYKLLFYKI